MCIGSKICKIIILSVAIVETVFHISWTFPRGFGCYRKDDKAIFSLIHATYFNNEHKCGPVKMEHIFTDENMPSMEIKFPDKARYSKKSYSIVQAETAFDLFWMFLSAALLIFEFLLFINLGLVESIINYCWLAVGCVLIFLDIYGAIFYGSQVAKTFKWDDWLGIAGVKDPVQYEKIKEDIKKLKPWNAPLMMTFISCRFVVFTALNIYMLLKYFLMDFCC